MSFPIQSLSPEEEIRLLKLELQNKVSELQKFQAISDQKNSFLLQQLEEVKAREQNIKSMNQTIMAVLQDITNSNSKISSELQIKQIFEEHIRSMENKSSTLHLEEELKRSRIENDRLRSLYDERYSDLLKEKESLNLRLTCLEEEKTKLYIELQNLRVSSQGSYEKLRLNYERELAKIKKENEEFQEITTDRCSMDYMKSQIKEMATQNLIETNSLKSALAETKDRLVRLHEAFCELKEKNSHYKALIQNYRLKEARLKDLLYEKPLEIEEELDEADLCFNTNFDGSFNNNLTLKPNRMSKQLEYSSISNIYDAFASQDYLKIFNDNQIISPLNSDRIEIDKNLRQETLKRANLIATQNAARPEEFSKPFELQQKERLEMIHGDSNKKESLNDSLDEFKVKGDIYNSSFINHYGDVLNRNKKTMKSLN